jgi:DNA-binding SARP family transcriptional activator
MLSRMILPEARGTKMGKYHAEHDLIEGLILLKEQRPFEAQAVLMQTEVALKTTGMKLQQIQANLLIAACHLEQEQVPEMLRRLEEVGAMLTAYECYKQRVPIELRHLPALAQAIRTLPEAAYVWDLLQLERQEQMRNGVTTFTELATSTPAQVVTSNEPLHLHILAFGEPVVLLDDQPVVGWRMARALELFFYLLDAGRPVRKEQLIAALWPEAREQVDHTFHNTIYYVRKAIGEACLVLAHNAYTLELTSRYGRQVCYDVARFEACSAHAREALARQDDVAAAPALEEMIELYRGDFLLPFYSDWCSARRESLRTAYLDAHLHLAQLAWQRQAYEECIEHWKRIVAIDPLREETHANLIRCYLRQGKRGLALRQYARCREALQQELGTEPGPSIQRLYQHLSSPR